MKICTIRHFGVKKNLKIKGTNERRYVENYTNGRKFETMTLKSSTKIGDIITNFNKR